MIGSRVKLVRDILGKTQEELADMIGTTQSGVHAIEAGIYRPSGEFLQTISRETGFDLSFFNRGEMPEFPFGSILFRAQAQVKQTPRTRAHAIAHAAFESTLDLALKLRKIQINIPRLDDDPRTCAQITRTSLGLSPNSPIRGLINILEKNGVFVFSIPMQVDGFDGFSAWAGSSPSRPVIALLRGTSPYREVFTCGEELAHLTMHSPLRVSASDADKEARIFAQEFLLPEEAMRSEMQQPITLSSLAALKPRWGVSIAFLAKRADSLGLITGNQYRYLIQQMRSRWGLKSEPGDELKIPERPALPRKMAEMLYPGKPVNIAKLSKDSGVSQKLLRDFMGIGIDSASLVEFAATRPLRGTP